MPAKASGAPLLFAAIATFAAHADDDAQILRQLAEQGDRGAVAAALDRGAAVDARGADGTTALHWAVRADNLPTRPVAPLRRRGGRRRRSIRRHAALPGGVNGNADIVARLLDAGVDPNTADPTGETALMTAARTGIPARCACCSTAAPAWTRAIRSFSRRR